ncbi:glutamate--cysteine ligase [Inmirania thermothiophila]|uniref:Glutamate--cysteine ligase n=1 Tax=Inmirania thermothiophila TaxID=1750597 RepID=A0A3N1Y9V5_9GAMM|nr:glutamate--cysteine ligase [Inmirania thermothiophila]ROR34177.1 glutamate--cysteine ligase [Inmirania thermothiophila]
MSAVRTESVPHLTTALTGPLLHLERHLLEHQARIEGWLRSQWQRTPPPFYASVDLRNAGFKLAPVDTNLFPAGFNNLSPAFTPLCVQAVQAALDRVRPEACRVLVVPENHTRNVHYLESLASLAAIIAKAGFEVRIGSLLPELEAPRRIELPSGRTVTLEPVRREGARLRLDDYRPCLVLLNNDLAGGEPELLAGLEQPVVPPPAMGWQRRRKSSHFRHYEAAARELAGLIGLDPWLVTPIFRDCGEIDFMKRDGEDCLARNTEVLLAAVEAKYREFGIDEEPFVVVKADSGTYGMAVMSVRSVEEVRELNRRQRTRMATTKGGLPVTRVIVQEGVPTAETWGEAGHVAEPVVYLIDRFVVGGFYRVHTRRGPRENLNAPGMHFEPLAFAEPCNDPDPAADPDAGANRFYAYGVVARLALVAAAREMAEAV